MGEKYEQAVLRLWFDWCKLWPEQYGRESLAVNEDGYDPIFDVIPSQAYKDFYYEVIRDHPTLGRLNAFEVVDITLNQIPAPELPIVAQEPQEPQKLKAVQVEAQAAQRPVEGKLPSNVIPHKPIKGAKHRAIVKAPPRNVS